MSGPTSREKGKRGEREMAADPRLVLALVALLACEDEAAAGLLRAARAPERRIRAVSADLPRASVWAQASVRSRHGFAVTGRGQADVEGGR